MVNTIRFEGNNFKSLQNKLPKCNYSNQNYDKQNIALLNKQNILDNNSLCVLKNKNEKLPAIKRPESAEKRNEKINTLVNRV